MGSEITIQCAVCGKPVDRVTMWRVEDSLRGTEIIVECHGKKDRMLLTDDFLANLGGDIRHFITSAVAFQATPLIAP